MAKTLKKTKESIRIGKLLLAARLDKRISQMTLAERLPPSGRTLNGVRSSIGRAENGSAGDLSGLMPAIAEFLGVPDRYEPPRVTPLNIGERVAFRRRALGLTQEQLARESGYSSSVAISCVERGEHYPAPRRIPKLAKALGTTVEYLETGKEEHKSLLPTTFAELTDTPSTMGPDHTLALHDAAIRADVYAHEAAPRELEAVAIARSIPYHHVIFMLKVFDIARESLHAPVMLTQKEWDGYYNCIKPAILILSPKR